MNPHSRYYKVAGTTIQINSDLPITDHTFHPKFTLFEVDGPEKDNITIHHHFDFFDLSSINSWEQVYFKPPWAIYKFNDNLMYKWIYPEKPFPPNGRVAYTNLQHEKIDIHNDEFHKKQYLTGNLEFLSMFPTDQILLGAAFAYLNGCILHSSGVEVDGKGLLFVGHSGAGKSTIASMFSNKIKSSKILCEDRNILRKINHNFFIGSAWSHTDLSRLSSDFPPVKAIFFLSQSDKNALTLITDKFLLTKLLLEHLIKPFVNRLWWDNILILIDQIIKTVPCWNLKFDRTGNIVEKIICMDSTH